MQHYLNIHYKCYLGMIDKCYNPKNKSYSSYSGKGIVVCDEWLEPNGKGFVNFIEDMGQKPSMKYTLDRINNNANYNRENCRWVNNSIQRINRGISIKNTSGKEGVIFDKSRNSWRARIREAGKMIHLGWFKNLDDAIKSRIYAENNHIYSEEYQRNRVIY